jgi:Lauroyl/myristoyl acyltransferase
VVFADTVRQVFERYESEHKPCCYMMLSDQSPSNPKKCFVTDFLHQRSGILFGAEHFAKKYDLPVVYYEVVKDRIGHYHLEFELITEKPNETEHGYITDRYVQLLEQSIRKQPAFWLWSHRRWKHDF